MNTRKIEALRQLYGKRASSSTMALPRAFSVQVEWSDTYAKWLTIGSCMLALIAIAAYVIAVNFMFLDGQAMVKAERNFAEIERSASSLKQALAEKLTPAWIVEQSAQNGMVAVAGVRYVFPDSSLAHSR